MEKRAKNKLEYGLGKITTSGFNSQEKKSTPKVDSLDSKKDEEIFTRVTIKVNYKLFDLIKRYARDQWMNQGDAILDALSRFFDEHEPTERPKEVVEREKMKIKMRQAKERRRVH